ncbi:ABC transporter substrate-binding protein [Pseudomonas grandcourensis]|uniref:ABC transporter substrate-binding protein n=1 Tax=Pseudomonas grandcourensis TaxID=3136736 RepID=UPI003265C42F
MNDKRRVDEYLEGMTRRGVLKGAAVLGLGLGLNLSLPFARAAEPKKGGTFRLGMIEGETTDTLDPRLTGTTYAAHVSLQLRNCLVEIGPDMTLVPELAESFEPQDKGAKWAFKLRSGVTFHNGKAMSPVDVIYSMNLHRGETSTSGAKSLLAQVKEIASDGDTVTFTLFEPNADFPFVLADYHLVIVPDGTTNFKDGMGTGGYVLESFQPGVLTRVRRNPDYWKPNRAHFEFVETISIPDSVGRNNALLGGAVDAIIQTDPKTANLLASRRGYQLIETKGTQHVTLAMRTDLAPFDNVDLRLALKHGIDREQLVKTLLKGHGVVGNDHPIASVNRYHADHLTQRSYDPDKAKFHLKRSGLSDLKLTLDASDAILAFGVDMAAIFQQSAAKAGINFDIHRNPTDGYWDSVWLAKPWFEGFWAGRPTADWMFTQGYAADARWNEAKWKNPRFNQLLVAARGELDEGTRAQMYGEMQALCSDDGGSIIPFFTNTLDAATDKVQFGQLSSNLAGDGARCAERWWFA